MSKVIVYLPEMEFGALQKLAQQEYRATKAQAAVIIRNELERLGLVPVETRPKGAKEIQRHPAGDMQ